MLGKLFITVGIAWFISFFMVVLEIQPLVHGKITTGIEIFIIVVAIWV